MRTVNKVILIWNITKDPFIRISEWGKKVAMFTVATNRQFKNLKWEMKSEAEYSNCVAWWSLADRCEKSLLKWKLVYLEGRLKTKISEKEDWTKSFRTEVVVADLVFLNKKTDFEQNETECTSDEVDWEVEEDDKF